jgi:hypothetical protein
MIAGFIKLGPHEGVHHVVSELFVDQKLVGQSVQIVTVRFIAGQLGYSPNALDARLNPICKTILKFGYEICQQEFDLGVASDNAAAQVKRLINQLMMYGVGRFFHVSPSSARHAAAQALWRQSFMKA